jgi:hypothetical protein
VVTRRRDVIPKRGPGRPPVGTKAKGNRTFRPEEDVDAFLEEAKAAGLEMTTVINKALRMARDVGATLGDDWFKVVIPRATLEGIHESEVVARLVKLGLEAESAATRKPKK